MKDSKLDFHVKQGMELDKKKNFPSSNKSSSISRQYFFSLMKYDIFKSSHPMLMHFMKNAEFYSYAKRAIE